MNTQIDESTRSDFSVIELSRELALSSDHSFSHDDLYIPKIDDPQMNNDLRRSVISTMVKAHNTATVDCNFSRTEAAVLSRFARETEPFHMGESNIRFTMRDASSLVPDLLRLFEEQGFQDPDLIDVTGKIAKALCTLAYGLHKYDGKYDFTAVPFLTPLHCNNYREFLNAVIVGAYHTHAFSLAPLYLNLPGACYILNKDVDGEKYRRYRKKSDLLLTELNTTAERLDRSTDNSPDNQLLNKWKMLQRRYVQMHQSPDFLKPGGKVHQVEAHQGFIISDGFHHRSPFLFEYDLKDGAGNDKPTKRFVIDLVGV